MASPDPERRPMLSSAEDGPALEPYPSSLREKPRKRRILPWLIALLWVLVVILVVAASQRCSAATSLFTNHGASRAGRAGRFRPGFRDEAVNTRSPSLHAHERTTATTSAAAPNRTVLKTFEVAQPVLMPDGPAESDGLTRDGKDYSPPLCTVLLMRHDFAWSYDAPFVGKIAHSLSRATAGRDLQPFHGWLVLYCPRVDISLSSFRGLHPSQL